MNSQTIRTTLRASAVDFLRASVAACCCLMVLTNVAGAQKTIKRDDARKLIAALSILELNKVAVTITDNASSGATATVVASVKLAFRFAQDAQGAWRVAEVRTGDRQWESFDLLARALGNDDTATARAALDSFAAELDAITKSVAASKDQSGGRAKELKQGALSVKNLANALTVIGTAAMVELEVETSVDFQRDARGRWQVSRVGIAGRDFTAFNEAELTLNAAKRERVRADFETLAAALEAYRRERGSYVVGETAAVLVDQLNPRHTRAFIRFDPWHRPYEYEGTRERYVLRSRGADGKANTPDDVTVTKG